MPNVLSMPEEERSRFIEVEWDQTKLDKSYSAVYVIADDRKGLLSDISRVCDDMDVKHNGSKRKKRQRSRRNYNDDAFDIEHRSDAEDTPAV